ncbi:ThiF family adenylyltransferase [Corynebacterium sp. UBA2622]|uniref:ThiF family adenylyltransferase n=1 Tax=Corynebacterium sp. UBA2622 TaxID=1946393 RepID=UPI0025B8D361|nr:ThiF family adenylyltransferase [Corynebacterium sp. UBA2622]
MSNPRYARQVALTGPEAQDRLTRAHVAVVGAGGLGSPALLYLAGAGVGRLTVIDDDTVELSNLHRQVVHSTPGIGRPKAASARDRLRELNPEVRVRAVEKRLTWPDAVAILAGADVVVDGSDNFDTRHIASHAAARLGVPHVWGSILGHEAQLSVFWAGRGPVYEDLFPAPPAPGSVPSCAQAGVLGPLVGMVGSAMAMETLKLITGVGTPLIGRLAYLDSLAPTWEEVPLTADPAVAERVLRDAPPHGPAEVGAIAEGATVIDVRETEEFETSHLPGSVNAPLSAILAGLTPPEAENGAVLVCARGTRSAQAVDVLGRRGATGLASLRGGLEGLGVLPG